MKDKKKGMPGEVISNSRVHEGTLKVLVSGYTTITKYNKAIKRQKKYIVGCDPGKNYEIGKIVYITHCKPISKRKHFKVQEDLNVN